MPVRSLRSSVMVWPTRDEVSRAVRMWAREQASHHEGLLGLGYFGSFARDDWGVGSDLDIVAVVATCDGPPERRTLSWDTRALPVPVDLIVYTRLEWQALAKRTDRYAQMLKREMVWLQAGWHGTDFDGAGR